MFTPGNRRATVLRMMSLPGLWQRRNGDSRRSRIRTVAILGLVISTIVTGIASSADAHGRSVSYSSWEIDAGGALVSVRIKLLELSRLGPRALPPIDGLGRDSATTLDPTAWLFPRDLVLVADDELCEPDPSAQRRPDDHGWVRYQWRVECPPSAGSLVIQSRILLEVAPSHLHFARVRFSENPERVREQVLTEASPAFEIRRADDDAFADDSKNEIGSRLRDYLQLGIEHILSGWDHLAFVFGLLLLASRFAEVARLVTGFTLAHSLTLALAVQGLVHPRAAAVEAVIAFSVALVAIEKGWLMRGRHRAVPIVVMLGLALLGLASMLGLASLSMLTVVGLALFTASYFALSSRNDREWFRICLTFAFGLVHGFGFAGVLIEMTLPTDRLVPALIGFNLGVELGQIGVVLLVWPLLRFATRFTSKDTARFASELSAAALCGLGLYWLVERAFPL